MKTATASGLLRADLTGALVVDVEDHPGAAGLRRARARSRRATCRSSCRGPRPTRRTPRARRARRSPCGRRSGSRVPSLSFARGLRVVCETLKRRAGKRSWSLRVRVVFPAPLGDERMRSRKGSTIAAARIIDLDATRRSELARACARSRPSARRPRARSPTSWLFEPMVLASRAISWSRKSRRRPTASELDEERLEVRRVALEARQLLADVDAVGEERDLLLEAPGVDLDVGGDAQPLGALLELLLVDLDDVAARARRSPARASAP